MRRLLEAILNSSYLVFGIGILIATTLLLLHLKKRSRWGLWYALMCVVTLLLSVICGSGEAKIGVFPAACVFVGAMTLLLWVCCDLPPIDALYGAICAYAAEHLATIPHRLSLHFLDAGCPSRTARSFLSLLRLCQH